MFGLFNRKKHSQLANDIAKETSEIVVKETEKLVHSIRLDFQHRFEELQGNIKKLNHDIKDLENKLLVKDLRDKQQYGQLHYKLHEVKNTNLEEEAAQLEKDLKDKDVL